MKLVNKHQLWGADLLVTNPKGIKKAIGEKTCNTRLINMHRAATIIECIEAVKLCKEAGWRVVVASHGSGEVFQDSVADLSVGLGSLGEIEEEHRCANAGSKSPVPYDKP
ncbi:Enolase [Parasponia andersonii]|uniref:phosphopyruvate hydratase n=1 Tax=Parasponia andersonii TaxID=3476 RepID=A0A2P5E3X9_PARAD|nr:Enolase [Parasponia andersonii]